MTERRDVTAILSVRNEEASLPHTLRRLVREGIAFAVIDHGSVDRTRAIVLSEEFRPWLVRLADMPFLGEFRLDQQLAFKSDLIRSLTGDWVIHLDADEVLQSPRPGETILGAIDRIDRAGYTVANFEEFVFLPIAHAFDPHTHDFQAIPSYYFFEPAPQRLMRAWKRSAALENRHSGGHVLSGADLRVCPENLILRHYIFRSQDHAFEKYAGRRFAEAELARGWHGNRFNQARERFRFPSDAALERLPEPGSTAFSRARPHRTHYWQW